MLNVKNTMVDILLSFIAPHPCSGCGILGYTFCDNCKYNIISEAFSCCIVCGKPNNKNVCYNHNLAFQQAYIVGERSGVLQRLIGSFKFRNVKEAALPLAELLRDRLPRLSRQYVIVPIPTIPAHIRERGYDHMELIAERLASLTHSSVARVLTRREMHVQHRSSREERLIQAQSAFTVESMLSPELTYILLDDIITTGATIQYAAQLLKDAGAKDIWVAAIARQPLD